MRPPNPTTVTPPEDWLPDARYDVLVIVGRGPTRRHEPPSFDGDICLGSGSPAPDPNLQRSEWSHLDLGDSGTELRLRSLPRAFADAIVHATLPPGLHVGDVDHYPYDHPLYAFTWGPVVETSSACCRWWDPIRAIQHARAAAQLVRPASLGLLHGATVRLDAHGSIRQIFPETHLGLGAASYPNPDDRDYLTTGEANEASRIFRTWTQRPDLPERVSRSLWTFFYLADIQHYDVRWPLLGVAFESLVNTGDDKPATSQFKHRVHAIAGALEIQMSKSKLNSIYEHRSEYVHGAAINDEESSTTRRELYFQAEDLLRQILRRCIEDDTFARTFQSACSIETNWPLPAPPPSK